QHQHDPRGGVDMAGHFKSVLSVFGTFGVLAAVVYTVVCAGIGWLLGGPAKSTRGVLALGTAQRNAAAAFVVAGQNFDDAKVIVMITVVLIVDSEFFKVDESSGC